MDLMAKFEGGHHHFENSEDEILVSLSTGKPIKIRSEDRVSQMCALSNLII